MLLKRIKEKISIYIVKAPGRAVLIGILIFNIILFLIAASFITALSPATVEEVGFGYSVFYTLSMILDAGCINYVINDIGQAGVALVIVCSLTILIGMITFTGGVIGYVTNMISNFIDNANFGRNKLNVSGHMVILNWNSRASEIINDLLFSDEKKVVVVLVNSNVENIKHEIADRLASTIAAERKKIEVKYKDKNFIERYILLRKELIKNKVTYVIKEGDTFSSKHLSDVSIAQASTIIILDSDMQQSDSAGADYKYKAIEHENGNSDTVKTLVQVSEFTAAEKSADNQVIIVETMDEWTLGLVNTIKKHKERDGKCNIIPVPVNKLLGQVLSQFSVMPELNDVYSELFSYRGVEFKNLKVTDKEEIEAFNKDKDEFDDKWIKEYIDGCNDAVALTTFQFDKDIYKYFIAEDKGDVKPKSRESRRSNDSDYRVKLKENFWLEKRNVIILGHNSRISQLMEGFSSFNNEWHFRDENGQFVDHILNIVMIDDKENLEKHRYYEDYPFVKNCIPAELFDEEKIKDTVRKFVDSNKEDTSVLILSDDQAPDDEIDGKALTYLIYVQDIKYDKSMIPGYDPNHIDVIVEILDPKNYDVVHSYCESNVVISNRYISKMILQVGDSQPLFAFYHDILTYDDGSDNKYDSKELYIKKVNRFMDEKFPVKVTARELIRGVYDASPKDNKSIVVGYVKVDKKTGVEITELFAKDDFNGKNKQKITLDEKDKLVLFSNH